MNNLHAFCDQLPEGPLAVAVSGGVDSLCALLLCKKAGRPVLAVHARLASPSSCLPSSSRKEAAAKAAQTAERLKSACRMLGCELHILDLQERFAREVVGPFTSAYAEGMTPNPCVLCNRRIKFGAFLDYALSKGAAGLVTGHYASLVHDHPYKGSAPLLCAAKDMLKDQSYFLGQVPRDRLAKIAFPLASLEKKDVRAIVAKAGLTVPEPKESQDICFIPHTRDGGYRGFLEAMWRQQGKKIPGSGDIVEAGSGRVIGRHKGLWQYTEGQRQGLGIPWYEPLYVLGKDAEKNVLLVGGKSRTRMKQAVLLSPNFMIGPDEFPDTVFVRLRYRQKPVRAHIRIEDGNAVQVLCEEELFLSAPGQTGIVLDDKMRILLAGTIQ